MLTADSLREAVAQAIFERQHRGLRDCWTWDDTGLDNEHPGVRNAYLVMADAALQAIVQAAGLDATDLHRAAYETDVGPLARHDNVAALLRALAKTT